MKYKLLLFKTKLKIKKYYNRVCWLLDCGLDLTPYSYNEWKRKEVIEKLKGN